MTTEYRGNALAEVEVALRLKKNGITLTRTMMEQLLNENAALVEKANELVRENNATRRYNTGLLKANALLNAGMGSLAERYDELKHEVRKLQRQIEGHCERIAQQSELLSRRAEKETAPVSQGGGCTMLTENAGG